MSNRKRYMSGFLAVVAALAAGLAGLHCSRPEPGSVPRAKKAIVESVPAHDDSNTISFVILPPEADHGTEGQTQAAGLFCDLLAERLSKVPGFAVVDRSRLDRILAERAIDGPGQPPLLSYDAMVRVRPEGTTEDPTVSVEVVDLSLGNLAASGKWQWRPGGDTAVSKAADLCASTRHMLTMGSGNRVKIRVLNVTAVDKVARLEPLGQRLLATFQETLARSPRVRLVHHLEAATAKEESLLLMMGLSRLPEGRTFSPQADATLQFRLGEKQAVGKTFEDTVIELAFRLDRAGVSGQWLAVTDKVSQWDELVSAAWARLSGELSSLDPGAAKAALQEMAIRRRQAQAELAKFDDWEKLYFPPPERQRRWQAAVTAAKLDPTNEMAAFYSVVLNPKHPYGGSYRTGQHIAERRQFLEGGLVYLRRFPQNAKRRAGMARMMWNSSTFSVSAGFGRRSICQFEQDDVIVRLAEELLNIYLADSLIEMNDWGPFTSGLILALYDAKRKDGMPKDQARNWMEQTDQRAWPLFRAWAKTQAHRREEVLWRYQSDFALQALRDNEPDRLRSVLKRILEEPTPKHGLTDMREMEERLRQRGEDELLERLQQWSRGERDRRDGQSQIAVRPLAVGWPVGRPLSDKPRRIAPTCLNWTRPNGKGASQRVPLVPLAVADGRLYVLFDEGLRNVLMTPASNTQVDVELRLGCVSLDASGAPAGDVQILAKPPLTRKTVPHAACLLRGRLYIGTEHSGILAYDVKAGTWKRYGTQEGLPDWNVGKLFVLDGRTLLCLSRGKNLEQIAFTLDVESESVKLLHRIKRDRPVPLFLTSGIWRDGDKVRALSYSYFLADILTPQPVVRPWPSAMPHKWPAPEGAPRRLQMAVVEDRRFVLAASGLYEIDVKANAVRTWLLNTHGVIRSSSRSLLYPRHEIQTVPVWSEIPGTIPGAPDSRCSIVAANENYMLLFITKPDACILYEPRKDRWHGPVTFSIRGVQHPPEAIATDKGFVFGGETLQYVSIADMIAPDGASDNAITSEQYRRRLKDVAKNLSELDKAKMAFAEQDFARSEAMLKGILKQDATNAEAMYLLGLMHHPACRNQPEVALEWFDRLAKMDDPSAALTGSLMRYYLEVDLQQWQEARDTGNRILSAYKLDEFINTHFRQVHAKIVKKAAAAVKQPAPAASNR